MTRINGSTKLLTLLVVLLLGIVSVQSVVLFNVYKGQQARPVHAEQTTLQLVPQDKVLQQGRSAAQSLPRRAMQKPRMPSMFGATGTWDPFAEMQRMQDEMDQMFEQAFGRFQGSHGMPGVRGSSGFAPTLDLEDDGDNYVARFDIPGADKSNIDVKIDDRMLTISGVNEENIEKKDGNQIIHVERRSGQFQRSLSLPGPVDASGLEAEYEDGVLTVTVPKAEFTPTSRSVRVL